ncbi:MAG: hypothetical protein ABA06_00900 [Parcubacteria bacterium C7867-001]|nr:MAG: hypothetical protein ABA06_00900 [Parcubacteria bacterium C7867-001]
MAHSMERNGTLVTGALFSTAVALLSAAAITVAGKVLHLYPISILAGLAAAPFVWVAVWNSNLVYIPTTERGILLSFGTRQKGQELVEGQHWILKWFNIQGVEHISMKERPIKMAGDQVVQIEVGDDTIIKTEVNIFWRPRVGGLFHFGNLADPEQGIKSDVSQVARAFGRECDNLEDFVGSKPAEALKKIITEHLQKRSNGYDCEILKVTKDPPDIQYGSEKGEAHPWGIEITSVAIPNFDLPENVTAAASEIAEAEKREEARVKLQATFEKSMDGFVAKGVDPVTAMGQAHSIVTPDRPSTTQTVNIAGLKDAASIIGTAIAAGLSGRDKSKGDS